MAPRKLERAPIIEVVCGFGFPPIEGLDPISAGAYWKTISAQFPAHQILPAVTDVVGFQVAHSLPQRALLTSRDDEQVIQIQADRFYFNWRKRAGTYPRFTGAGGVLDLGLKEFARFAGYCEETFGARPQPQRVDLSKVDLLPLGGEWQDLADLAVLVPLLQPFVRRTTKEPDLSIRWSEIRSGADLFAALHLGIEPVFNELPALALKIETRMTKDSAPERVPDVFALLNKELNDVFFGLLNEGELHRFGGK